MVSRKVFAPLFVCAVASIMSPPPEGVTHVPSPRQKVAAVAPVPELSRATARLPLEMFAALRAVSPAPLPVKDAAVTAPLIEIAHGPVIAPVVKLRLFPSVPITPNCDPSPATLISPIFPCAPLPAIKQSLTRTLPAKPAAPVGVKSGLRMVM